ncbi:hypothetical protein [Streptomyces sp. BPTC-684]|uniref:hypothetical protein n=1 Tax=Streptomyces sp. BPTC-684 TaxID=3043734 RepID=UPI0024B0A286|nr:hypothetical protein [Streptomyces sp. BPTC-684]WHM39408.1 hypothetical protein QIY60_22690 [Streptomyces sp. BPTC-684]
MTKRGEGMEDESGWAFEYDPSAEWVLGDMPDDLRDEVERIAAGLTDLAALGLDPKDGSLADDLNPMRLRTYEDEHLMLWYQTIPHRKRVYLKRVNLWSVHTRLLIQLLTRSTGATESRPSNASPRFLRMSSGSSRLPTRPCPMCG